MYSAHHFYQYAEYILHFQYSFCCDCVRVKCVVDSQVFELSPGSLENFYSAVDLFDNYGSGGPAGFARTG